MDRLINYGGWTKPINPTSNSEYGRGVVSSMRKAQATTAPTFDPSGPQYYYPQAVTSGGGGQWQQPMGSGQGHVHAPNCPRFGTGANSKYPTGNFGGAQYQLPGVGSGSNVVHTADHIEVLHGDAAQAYLAQQSGGDGSGQGQAEQGNYYSTSGNAAEAQTGSFPPGMTISFQTAEDAGAGEAGSAPAPDPSTVAAQNGTTKTQRGSGDYVKVNGLPMDRNRWRHGSAPTPSTSHVVSSARNLKGSASAFKLCGKCPKCKTLQDPTSNRPSTVSVQGPGTGAKAPQQRFPVPRGLKPTTPSQQPGIAASQRMRRSQTLPIQGESFSVNMPSRQK